MQTSPEIDKLCQALIKLHEQVPGVVKTAYNPFTKSKYADLFATWEAIRQPLVDAGLLVVQPTAIGPRGPIIETWIIHIESGQSMKSELEMPMILDLVDEKNDGKGNIKRSQVITPQVIGAAITYARRYSITTFLGIAPEDDDGNQASGRNNKNGKKKESGEGLTEQQTKAMWAAMKSKAIDPEVMKDYFGISSSKELKQSQFKEVMAWINSWSPTETGS